jgi:hypothetical protein
VAAMTDCFPSSSLPLPSFAFDLLHDPRPFEPGVAPALARGAEDVAKPSGVSRKMIRIAQNLMLQRDQILMQYRHQASVLMLFHQNSAE